jgi:peptide/nickel transport system substrate-binding protein
LHDGVQLTDGEEAMNTVFARLSALLLAAAELCAQLPPAAAAPIHAIAMHGEPKYPASFKHFDYVNPDAPKGGSVAFGVLGSFDSVNPLIIKGNAAPGMRELVYESLLGRANDEPFSLYGLLAESIDVPEDRSSVTFILAAEARFSDGRPVTVADVIFSLELLREKGRPNHRSYYSKVDKIEQLGERAVKLTFKADSGWEMPLIMGLMPVLPMHAVDPTKFEITSFAPAIGSGPYVVASVDAGNSITYRRDPNYWGRDLPINRGRFNFDEIRYDFYRDGNGMFEAFKKGLFQFTTESDPGRWAREYDFPAVADGRVVKQSFDVGVPAGMSGLVFNTRRPFFADRRVREAVILLFDFEWQNKNLHHGLYERTQSYFDGSELSSHGRPADGREKLLLAQFPEAVSAEAMNGTLTQPATDGSGRDRGNLRRALQLLAEAGYELKDGKLVNTTTKQPAAFELLALTRDQERLFLTFARDLLKAGIQVSIRQVDSAQYQSRKTSFDFDMLQNSWPVSLSPGNEQNNRWSSEAADAEGSLNYPGVKNPAVDAMIAALLAAKGREEFVAAVRALDRVLLSGAYVVPLYHLPSQWVAYWTKLHHPEVTPLYGPQIDCWWIDGARERNGRAP